LQLIGLVATSNLAECSVQSFKRVAYHKNPSGSHTQCFH